MLTCGEIDITVYNYLVSKEARTPNLYLLPKIHKGVMPPPGRPIMSANGSPTEKISEFVDHFISEFSTKHKSYVRDTTHFLQKIKSIRDLPENSLLVTFDVTSLYTNIPNHAGVGASKQAFRKFRSEPGLKPTTRV
jgi:hypothetical protein